jgi:hypothetical protein
MSCLKEEAERVLQDNPTIDGYSRRYFTAIIEGKLPQFYLDEFFHRRYGYIDDLPIVDVRTLIQSLDDLVQYKCQTNYVVGLALNLRGAIEDGVIDNPELQQDIDEFLISDLNFQVGDPNNTRRINSINVVLDKTIAHLSKRT